jgi:AraC-like DNA-binding protein
MKIVQLMEGDVAFLPKGKPHFIAHSATTECADMKIIPGSHCMHTDIPDDEADVRVLCGIFQPVEDFQHPLFLTLPEFIHARFSEDTKKRSWGSHAAYAIDKATELRSPGMDVLIDRLHEVLFIQLLQQHYSGYSPSDTFYCSRNAPRIYRVLEVIHQNPGSGWTLDSMAELAHMSRSAFTSNFREIVGMSPMSYLTSWRMNSARSLVRTTGLPMKVIAKQTGFRTQAGFNKAFKQFFGIPPKKLRNEKTESVRVIP